MHDDSAHRGIKVVGAIFLMFVLIIAFTIMYQVTGPRAPDKVPAKSYLLSTGQKVTEFNTLSGARCIAMDSAVTCNWNN